MTKTQFLKWLIDFSRTFTVMEITIPRWQRVVSNLSNVVHDYFEPEYYELEYYEQLIGDTYYQNNYYMCDYYEN